MPFKIYEWRKNSESEYYIYDENGRLTAKAAVTLVSSGGSANIEMYPVKQYIWGPDRGRHGQIK